MEIEAVRELTPSDPRWHELSTSQDPMVRTERAQRGRLTDLDVEALLEDPDELVRAALAGRRELTDEQRWSLSLDDSELVQQALATSKWSSPRVLKSLSSSWYGDVRLMVSTRTGGEVLDGFKDDDEAAVRLEVARKTTNPDVLDELIGDESDHVVGAAYRNISARPSTCWPLALLRGMRGTQVMLSTRAQLSSSEAEAFAALEESWNGTLADLVSTVQTFS